VSAAVDLIELLRLLDKQPAPMSPPNIQSIVDQIEREANRYSFLMKQHRHNRHLIACYQAMGQDVMNIFQQHQVALSAIISTTIDNQRTAEKELKDAVAAMAPSSRYEYNKTSSILRNMTPSLRKACILANCKLINDDNEEDVYVVNNVKYRYVQEDKYDSDNNLSETSDFELCSDEEGADAHSY